MILSSDVITAVSAPLILETLILVATVFGSLLLRTVVVFPIDNICNGRPSVPIYSALCQLRIPEPLVVQVKTIVCFGDTMKLAVRLLIKVTSCSATCVCNVHVNTAS